MDGREAGGASGRVFPAGPSTTGKQKGERTNQTWKRVRLARDSAHRTAKDQGWGTELPIAEGHESRDVPTGRKPLERETQFPQWSPRTGPRCQVHPGGWL